MYPQTPDELKDFMRTTQVVYALLNGVGELLTYAVAVRVRATKVELIVIGTEPEDWTEPEWFRKTITDLLLAGLRAARLLATEIIFRD